MRRRHRIGAPDAEGVAVDPIAVEVLAQSPETEVTGRYVMPNGSMSRDPLGSPVVKCTVDTSYTPAGPANRVFVQGEGNTTPSAWMSLSGRRQSAPDRNTRGYFDSHGNRVWLDVFPPLD